MSSEIKINRNQRRWHKYGKLIIGLAIAAAAVIVIICIAVAATGNKGGSQTVAQSETATSEEVITDSNGNTITSEDVTEPAKTSVKTVSGKPAATEFAAKSAFEKSVFMGDVFINTLSQYDYIDDYYIWTSNSFSTQKADGYVKDAAELKPEKIYLMFGFDDAGLFTFDESVKNYEKLIADIKTALPTTQIYLISELPVTKEFDSEPGDINQDALDAINDQMQERASALGVTYIDVATAFKSGKNIADEYATPDGYHIKETYYPFVLNNIAELTR